MPEGALLVSQTDPGGKIVFVNDAFVAISGFTRAELIGAPHNLVRHPHMPKEAFRDLWTTVKAGNPWDGLVKNRTRNGDFYWVQANVTPVVEDGELRGFISIRTRPARSDVAAAEVLYAAMREGRSRGVRVQGGAVVATGVVARTRQYFRGIASGNALNLGLLVAAIAASITAGMFGIGAEVRAPALLGVSLVVLVAMVAATRRMHASFRHIETQFGALARGDLQQPIDAVAIPELQRISLFLRSLRAKLAYAEEVRAQNERDATHARVAAVRDMADRMTAE
ncbi:MAG TPA: PAS domain-containing protein, partial [Casimicrobiaceae bacterium]